MRIKFGLIIGVLLLIPLWSAGQQMLKVNERSKEFCPVSQGVSKPDEASLAFYKLHQDSLYHNNSLLLEELMHLERTGLFKDRDTLRFFAHWFQGKAQRELKMHEEAAQTFALLLENPLGKHLVEEEFTRVELAMSFLNAGKYTQARQNFQQVRKSPRFRKSIFLQDAVYLGLGLCFQRNTNAKPDSAIYFYQQAARVQQASGDEVDLATTYLNLGAVYFENYQDKQALEMWRKSLVLAEKHQIINIQDDLYYNLAQLLEETGYFQEALQYQKAYLKIQDSIWNRDRLWELAEQKRLFAVSQKNDSIRLLEQDAALQAAEIREKENERNTLLGVSLGLISLIVLLILLYRTSRKKNEVINRQKEHLDRLNATKDQLFAIVSHDLRSPVQALSRTNQLLQEELDDADQTELANLLKRNQSGIEGTTRLLDNLLHWSLNEAGTLFIQVETLRLRALIDQVHYDYRAILDEKQISFENAIAADLLVQGDPQTLKIVLRNLLDNAIRFTPTGGSIALTPASRRKGFAAFAITDTGPGVPANRAEQLFLPPDRKSRAADDSGRVSSGLGLFLCFELLQKNQGLIALDASYTQGARFVIQLMLPKS